MADTYTGVAASNFDQAAYDLRAFYALRYELYHDALATVKPTAQSMNGSTVTFTITTDLSAATTALSESSDVSAVALSDAQVVLTLVEYGNAAITTAKLRGTTFIPYDPVVANIIGYNAGISLDTIARDVLKAGSNAIYAGQAAGRTTVIPTDTMAAADVREAVAFLRRGAAQPFNGYYCALIHPDVSADFRGSTGTNNWSDPHAYSEPADIWNGEVGVYGGCRFIETPRAVIFADAGSSTTNTDVYATLFLGQEALAKAHSMSDGNGPLPTIVPGPVTDHLRRFVPMGWYWFGAYGIFRQAALVRLESASSIGSNTALGSN